MPVKEVTANNLNKSKPHPKTMQSVTSISITTRAEATVNRILLFITEQNVQKGLPQRGAFRNLIREDYFFAVL